MALRVLIADNSSTMRMIINRSLHSLGVQETVEATDGDEAISLFEQREFDLVLLDWYMQRVNGLDVLRVIRSGGSQVPVMMVTAEAEKDYVVRAIQAGASEYLVKPFDVDTLREKLEKLCPSLT